MRREKRKYLIYAFIFTLVFGSIILGIIFLGPGTDSNSKTNINETKFPDFITNNDDYYITRIGDIPNIDSVTYRLNVWGQIDNPRNFTLSELRELDLVERALTTECIGNLANGPLISTSVWKGFLIYDFLETLGLKENATGVKYMAADGYYVSHTLDQLRDNGIMGALYMNGYTLPPTQGFPLRIVNPGAYGAKQPAWVIDLEVSDRPLEDFWDDRGWDTSPPMAVDSIIFFPNAIDYVTVNLGNTLRIGGAAFGGTRISKIEYTIGGGLGWSQAVIIDSIDADHVWVFWEVNITFNDPGTFTFYSRATDVFNNTQPMIDSIRNDGFNSWPTLIIKVNS